jgi:hypothetical protein
METEVKIAPALHFPVRRRKRNAEPRAGRFVFLPECLVCACRAVLYFECAQKLKRIGKHCLNCHSRDHNSCAVCHGCMPNPWIQMGRIKVCKRVRFDRKVCSSKCRQQAYRWRHWKETEVEIGLK